MNDIQLKNRLWSELGQLDRQLNYPWLLCGDFNSVLSSGDRIGSTVTTSEPLGFRGLIDDMHLTPLRITRCHYTWCNKQSIGSRVYIKIDWELGDIQWLQRYGQVEADFLHPSISDHSPILIKPFKFFINLMEHPKFKSVLQHIWATENHEKPMENVWWKLMKLKAKLKDINTYMASYHQHLSLGREELDIVQGQMKG
ncbi:hypothetical protein R3W88_031619 [Solanum pinnatisectum]|uniref:Endonuclease/exonuclease/phosphatase domain-containing protein n=1 Tax=Solanum pinnatisectum TaxID=50273 RepID=A0AAV9LQS6_9SOLN|nr:hypothetical protein R3W88_031619 [Solanum pinnatisectum]